MTTTSRSRTVDQKVDDWKDAMNRVAPVIHTPGMVELLGEMQMSEAMRDLPLYIQLARIVSANQRAAATVAALLVQSGIKPTSVNFGDDE